MIDSVLDFDMDAGAAPATGARRRIVAHIRGAGLRLDWILETHVHADHLSAAPYLRDTLGGRIGDRREDHHRPAHLRRDLQRRARLRPRRLAVRPPVRGRRALRASAGWRPSTWRRPGHTPACGSLQGRRQHLRRRHALHARLRHGALRLPRRRRAHHVPLDPPHPRLPPADRALDVPRLQGAGPRRATPGAPRSAPSASRTRRCATASARTSSWRCARRRTRPSARRSC